MARLNGSKKYILRENGFIGYNDRLPPEQLEKGYLADCLNALCKTGEIVKRNGYTIIGNDLGTVNCQGMRGVEFTNATKEVIGVFNGLTYKWTGSGNWSALSGTYTLSATANVDIVVANNNVYFFDGTNTVPKYNGTTMSTVAAIPIGTMAKWFHNQLHIAGIDGSPNTLRSSDVGDPETHTGGASSNLAINPNDGDIITGLNTLSDNLFIFKRYRSWSATGFGTSALTLSSIAERVTGAGTLSHKSIVNTGNDLLFITFYGGIPHFRSIRRTEEGILVDGGIISKDIEVTMNGLNKARLNQCVGIFDGRLVWWALCNGASTTNNLVLTYDTVTGGWQRHTGINANAWESFAISTTPQIYFGEATADSKAYRLDTSTSDNGTAINFQIDTRRYGGNKPELKKKWKWLYVRPEETGDYDITMDYSVDGFDYNNLGTLNLAGTGSVLDSLILDTSRLGTTDVKRDRFTIPKSRNYYIQFRMSDTSATSVVTFRDWELIYLEKGRPIDE